MKKKQFVLYWTNLERYETCPQKFLWYKGWEDIDTGGGPGRPKPKPYKSSMHHAVMGIVIQAVLERFYNDELWKSPKGLTKVLDDLIEKEYKLLITKKYIDWRQAGSPLEMQQVIREGVFGYLKTFKEHKLAGQYAKSEVRYVSFINKWNPIGGILDFLIRREDNPGKGITILDGKNSLSKGKYTNPDQLRWYALCFYLFEGILVDRLGFVYFRYPMGYLPPKEKWEKDVKGVPIQPEAETGIDWIPFTKEDLKGLAKRAVDARTGMHKRKFTPTPKPSKCRLCDYESVCDVRQAQIAQNRRKPKNKKELFDGATGLIEFGITT